MGAEHKDSAKTRQCKSKSTNTVRDSKLIFKLVPGDTLVIVGGCGWRDETLLYRETVWVDRHNKKRAFLRRKQPRNLLLHSLDKS